MLLHSQASASSQAPCSTSGLPLPLPPAHRLRAVRPAWHPATAAHTAPDKVTSCRSSVACCLGSRYSCSCSSRAAQLSSYSRQQQAGRALAEPWRPPGGRRGPRRVGAAAAASAAAAGAAGGAVPASSNPLTAVGAQVSERTWRWLAAHAPALASAELRRRLAFTLFIAAAVRCGYYVPLPGVADGFLQGTAGELAAYREMLAGGSELPVNLFMLGLGPVINASYLFSLATVWRVPANPFLKQVEEMENAGREGEMDMRRIISWLVLLCSFITAAFTAVQLKPLALQARGFLLGTTLTLTAATVAHKWLGEQVEDGGMGDGISLLITCNILSSYVGVLSHARGALLALPWQSVVGIAAAAAGLLLGAVWVTGVELRLPLQHYRPRHTRAVGGSDKSGTLLRSGGYLPIQLAPSGLTPVLMTNFLIRAIIAMLASKVPAARAPINWLMSSGAFVGLYGVLIFLSMFFDVSAKQRVSRMDQYLTQSNTGLKGYAPGEATRDHLEVVQSQVRLLGSAAVALLAMAAEAFDEFCQRWLGSSLGSLSFLLVIGWALQILRQARSLAQMPLLELQLERERRLVAAVGAGGAGE